MDDLSDHFRPSVIFSRTLRDDVGKGGWPFPLPDVFKDYGFETILSHSAWKNGAVDAKIINIFQAFSTEKMCQEKPLGEWFNAECYIFSFAPPERKNPTKSKAKGKKV